MAFRPEELEYYLAHPEELGTSGAEEARRLLEEYRRSIQEDTQNLLGNLTKVSDGYERLVKNMGQAFQTETSLKDYLTSAGKALGDGLSTALNVALSRSLPASLASIQPGLGQVGENLGKTAASALVLSFTGNPILAAMAGQVGRVLTREIQMQYEGYTMIGATVAPQAYAGFNVNVDYRRVGEQYREGILEVSRATGATADQVAKLFDQLSKVGVGFLEGGKEASQYALAAERVMNLNQGVVSSIQVELITKYGERVENTKNIMGEMRNAQRELIGVYSQTGNEVAKALAAGQIYVDTLQQIRSAATQSGASMEGLNQAGEMLIKTMASAGPGGAPMARIGQMGGIGGQLLSGLMPQTNLGMEEEARRSGLDWMMLQQTQMGQEQMRELTGNRNVDMRDPSNILFLNMKQSQKLAQEGGAQSDYAIKTFISRVAGLSKMAETSPYAALAYGDLRGIGTGGVVLAQQLVEQWKKLGFDPDKLTENNYKYAMDYLKAKQKDPEVQKLIDRLGMGKDIQDVAAEQGKAMISTLQSIADLLTNISINISKVWGTDKNSSPVMKRPEIKALPEDNPVARGDAPPSTSLFMGRPAPPAGYDPNTSSFKGASPFSPENYTTDTLTITGATQNRLVDEHIKGGGVKETAGQ